MKFVFEDKHYVNNQEKLIALDEHLMEGDTPKFPLLGYDTETNGLFFFKNVIIGFSISTDKNSGFYVPLLEWHPDLTSLKTKSIKKVKYQVYEKGWFDDVWNPGVTYPETVTPKEYRAPDFIKAFVKRWLTHPNVQLVMHNAPFDCNMTSYNLDSDLGDQLFVDTILLKHAIDENTDQGLKEVATLWKKELGFDASEDERQEQKELGLSIIRNGGTFNARTKHIWRGNPYMVAKYGAKDTALTLGVLEVGLQKFEQHFTPAHFDWFFDQEVMPLCREVVIPMRYGGIFADIPYFERVEKETRLAMERLEDEVQKNIASNITDFAIGESRDEAVKQGRIIKKIMELEGLDYPTQVTKGVVKESLGKKAVQNAYQQNPHWLWGYILGLDEIKYSSAKMDQIKDELYMEILERRYRFNIRSPDHLRWLFCDKLGYDKKKLPQTDSATPDNPIPSMAAEVLEEHFLKDHPWVRSLMKYKKLDKLHGTYICPILELNHNGWLHMDMKQSGTISGRFSCSGGFNLQTLPKVEELENCAKCESKKIKITQTITLLADLECQECGHRTSDNIFPSGIKAGFIAPPGYKIINADYSSLEPRCFAFMSGDDKLKQVYREGLDIYSKVYCDMLDLEKKYSAHPDSPNFLKKTNKSARDLFKPVVLGIPYGARAPQVANLMNLKKKIRIKDKETGVYKEIEILDVEAGARYRTLYLDTYQDLNNYMTKCENDAVTKGYVETVVGRRRHFIYAKFIYRLLNEFGVEVEEFLDAKYKHIIGRSALDGKLNEKALLKFCDHFHVSLSDVLEKDGWAYIRHLFSNELNNAKNFPIQGLAAHITNNGMLDTRRAYKAKNIDGYVCLQVHDEITSYARIDQAELAASLQKTGMEKNIFALKVDVPMEAAPIICNNLKESK